jgi:pimeloyl-ACP methyl ester carboxylesterase
VDRSWLFNLGVKINEATGATILWPDLRGHGLNPAVSWTSFGSLESNDIQAALDYLRTQKSTEGQTLVGDKIGLYGIEMGAYASLRAAVSDASVRVLVLDSLPRNPEDVLHAAVRDDLEIDNRLLHFLTLNATKAYFLGRFDNTGSCELAAALKDQRVLLLSGPDAGYLRESTLEQIKCFPNTTNLETKTDLPLTGFRLPSATGEQGEGYDRIVIDFFDRNLR